MSALSALPFDAVLFDCDGVLVDSERITHIVLVQMLGELGWTLSVDEAMGIFVGKMVKDEAALIQKHTGFRLTDAWLEGFRARRNEALARDLIEIPGAPAAVRAVRAAYDGRIAVASGADRRKVELQLRKVGLLDCFGEHIYSGHETPRSKPHPDVYLAAAAAPLRRDRGHRDRRARGPRGGRHRVRLQPRRARPQQCRGTQCRRCRPRLHRHGAVGRPAHRLESFVISRFHENAQNFPIGNPRRRRLPSRLDVKHI
jgi:beta-phosphoglucomutase-like phosphatase (HAD superfamily)